MALARGGDLIAAHGCTAFGLPHRGVSGPGHDYRLGRLEPEEHIRLPAVAWIVDRRPGGHRPDGVRPAGQQR